MATFTPANIVPVTAMSASGGTSLFTGTAAHTYICRTIHFSSSATKTVTLSFGADAAGKRLFDGTTVTAAVPAIYNGWWSFAGAGAHDIDGNVNSTTAQVLISGYDYA